MHSLAECDLSSQYGVCGSVDRHHPILTCYENFWNSTFACTVQWGMQLTPKFWYLMEIFEILILHVLSNDAYKFAMNLFLISWGPLENVNFLFFLLLKLQIWNGCNVLNIAENPIKDINVNISQFRIKSCEIEPAQFWHLVEIFDILLLHILSNDACKFAINLFSIVWEPLENVNLLYFPL